MVDRSKLNKSEAMIIDFWEKGWAAKDVDKIMEYLSDDIEFIPAPAHEPVKGWDKCKELFTMYNDGMLDYTLEFNNIMGTDKIVFLERTEYCKNHSDGTVALMPLVGVFELNEEGKICAWRDFCDTAGWPD